MKELKSIKQKQAAAAQEQAQTQTQLTELGTHIEQQRLNSILPGFKCSPATADKILTYMRSVAKTNLNELTLREAEKLVEITQPLCQAKGCTNTVTANHVNYNSGACVLKRSGPLCQGSAGVNIRILGCCKYKCLPCQLWG